MEKRTVILKHFLIGIFAIVLIRLFSLQIISHKHYVKSSQNNTYLNIRKTALRADIKDRNGVLLATSNPLFTITFYGTKDELKHIEEILRKKILQEKDKLVHHHTHIKIKNLNWNRITKIFELNSIPMPDIEQDQTRTYPLKESAAHLIGYIKSDKEHEYIGTSGIEGLYNESLIGLPGKDVFLINAQRKRMNKTQSNEPKKSDPLFISIDARLQQLAHQLLAQRIKGATMLVDIETGEILAANSFPSFNPEYFANHNMPNRTQMLKQYQTNPLKPLFNLYLNGVFPPGSTLKPFMLIGFLKKKVPAIYDCQGVFYLGKTAFRCLWNHGPIHISKILPTSCNCAFYAHSQHMRQEDLKEVWDEFGLGQPVLKGLYTSCPKFPGKEKWKKIDALFMQIGQGATLTTMAQLTRAYARIASGKKIDLTFEKQETIPNFPNLNFDIKHLEIARKAMHDTVNQPYGTAYGRYKFINAAGKTGTAQVTKIKDHEYRNSNAMREWKFKDHAWFCAYAPFDKPKYCACTIIYHGGGGPSSAPITLELLDKAMQLAQEDANKKEEAKKAKTAEQEQIIT